MFDENNVIIAHEQYELATQNPIKVVIIYFDLVLRIHDDVISPATNILLFIFELVIYFHNIVRE